MEVELEKNGNGFFQLSTKPMVIFCFLLASLSPTHNKPLFPPSLFSRSLYPSSFPSPSYSTRLFPLSAHPIFLTISTLYGLYDGRKGLVKLSPKKISRSAMFLFKLTEYFCGLQDSLTTSNIQEYKSLFKALDEDNDGFVTRDDIKGACTTFGCRKSSSELDEMWEEASGGASKIDFNKFVTMIDGRMAGFVNKDSLFAALGALDRNQGREDLVGGGPGPRPETGILDADSLEVLLIKSGIKLSAAEVDEFFNSIQIDADGNIKIEDIVTLLLES